MKQEFLNLSKEFWAFYPPGVSSHKILLEEESYPPTVHCMGIFSVILNQAKRLIPVALEPSEEIFQIMQSYLSNFEKTALPKLSLSDKFKILILAVWKTFLMRVTSDILGFSYDKVRYGDIVYDTYLSQQEVATIRKVDWPIVRIIYSCISRHERIRKFLIKEKFDAVMVCHQIGIKSGVMLRTALRYGCLAYLRTGHHQSALLCFSQLEEVYNYPQKPSPKDIEHVIKLLGPDFEFAFESFFKKETSGQGGKDSLLAFSTQNKLYKDRNSFLQEFALDPSKKNIFVMLHAFNDAPHSHFEKMVFKDYYDWFIQTLAFAKTYPQVNWIFKQHPSIRHYPAKDVDWERIFKGLPKNIIYLDENRKIDTRSLIACADCVITCLGSVGFQLPALARIPSIAASDNHYTNLGFALEPQTKEEYFEILKNLNSVQLLTAEQQKLAKAAYLYIHYFSRVYLSACPQLSVDDEKSEDIGQWYWHKVSDLYKAHGNKIKQEIQKYIQDVSKSDFHRLESLSTYSDLLKEQSV